MSKGYKTEFIKVVPLEKRRASWTTGRWPVSGEEHIFRVEDENYSKLNDWTFVVSVPIGPSNSIIVQPTQVPGKKVWAGAERRSIVWRPATINAHKKQLYCKLSLADPTQAKTKVGLGRGEGTCSRAGLRGSGIAFGLNLRLPPRRVRMRKLGSFLFAREITPE